MLFDGKYLPSRIREFAHENRQSSIFASAGSVKVRSRILKCFYTCPSVCLLTEFTMPFALLSDVLSAQCTSCYAIVMVSQIRFVHIMHSPLRVAYLCTTDLPLLFVIGIFLQEACLYDLCLNEVGNLDAISFYILCNHVILSGCVSFFPKCVCYDTWRKHSLFFTLLPFKDHA